MSPNEAVRARAAEAGVEIASSEIVGLVPVSVLAATAARAIKAPALQRHHAIEAAVIDQLADGDTDDVAVSETVAP